MATRAELERMRIEKQNRQASTAFFGAPSTPHCDFDEPPDLVEVGSAQTPDEWAERQFLENNLQCSDPHSPDVLEQVIAREESQLNGAGGDDDPSLSPYPPRLHWIAASVGETLP